MEYTFRVGDVVRRVKPSHNPIAYGEVDEEYVVLATSPLGIKVKKHYMFARSSAFILVKGEEIDIEELV